MPRIMKPQKLFVMQTFIESLTTDAQVNELKDVRKAVFKNKGSQVAKKISTYINCAKWLSVCNTSERQPKASPTQYAHTIQPPIVKTTTTIKQKKTIACPFIEF